MLDYQAGEEAGIKDATLEIDGQQDGSATIHLLADAGIYPAEVALRRPSLEQIYLELTGESPAATEPAA